METDDANGRRKYLNGSRLLAFSASTRLKTVAVILSAKYLPVKRQNITKIINK